MRARAISRVHQLLASLKKGDKNQEAKEKALRCATSPGGRASRAALLHVASAPAAVTGEGANPREKQRREAAVLSATCCRRKLQRLFSRGCTSRTLRWFRGRGQVLARANPAASQRHRQQFPRVRKRGASWDTGGKAPTGFSSRGAAWAGCREQARHVASMAQRGQRCRGFTSLAE